jgi:hypothetical protein
VSLVDASFLCILRCIMHALCRAKDAYLLSNSCAILHNLVGALPSGGLQPYAAERVVRVTVQLCRRAEKESVQRTSAGSVEGPLLSEALGTMMQVLDSALR